MKTSVEIDKSLLREAQAVLGTTTLRATIDAALRDVVDARSRVELIALVRDDRRFDFDAAAVAWGGET